MSGYRHNPDEWPWTAPPETPPTPLFSTLQTPLRQFAGCWIESQCPGCRHKRAEPIRMLLTERRERADMPLRRAVSALHFPGCQVDRRLALVSDPKWQSSKAAGKPPNWSLQLTGREAGSIAYTDHDTWPYDRK